MDFENGRVDMPDGTNIEQIVFDSNNQERPAWKIFGHFCPRSALVFLVQVLLGSILVITSIVCICLAETCEESTVWIAILSSCVGYFLPSPRL